MMVKESHPWTTGHQKLVVDQYLSLSSNLNAFNSVDGDGTNSDGEEESDSKSSSNMDDK